MTDHYFNALEQKIDLLIKRLRQLEEQNQQLRVKNGKLEDERAQLLQMHEGTKGRVESMLNRLKALEKSS